MTATTYAGAAWWSEVAAKTALLAGSANAIDLLHDYGAAGIVVTDDGTVLQTEIVPARKTTMSDLRVLT